MKQSFSLHQINRVGKGLFKNGPCTLSYQDICYSFCKQSRFHYGGIYPVMEQNQTVAKQKNQSADTFIRKIYKQLAQSKKAGQKFSSESGPSNNLRLAKQRTKLEGFISFTRSKRFGLSKPLSPKPGPGHYTIQDFLQKRYFLRTKQPMKHSLRQFK